MVRHSFALAFLRGAAWAPIPSGFDFAANFRNRKGMRPIAQSSLLEGTIEATTQEGHSQ